MTAPHQNGFGTEGKSLHDLRSDLFAAGGLIRDLDTTAAVSRLTPQLILHWAGRKGIFSHDTEAAHVLMVACVHLGADPLHMDAAAVLRKASVMPPLQWTQSADGPGSVDVQGIEWTRISPLGSALLARDTPLLMSMVEIIGASSPARNPNSAVVRIKSPTGPLDVDAWSICGRIGTHMPLNLLAQAFGIQADDPRQEMRMGKALCVLLADRKAKIHDGNGVLRLATRRYLLAGSVPEAHDLRAIGIDPAWVVGVVSAHNDPDDHRALQRLIDIKLPLSPKHDGVVPPLHIAAAANNAPGMIALLEGGADPRVRDVRGFTLEQAVHADDRQALIDVLRVWTARQFALDAMGLFNTFRSSPKRSMFRGKA